MPASSLALAKTGVPCAYPRIIHRETSDQPCHYCSLPKWRSMSKICGLLHNMRCRQCGRRKKLLYFWDKTLSDALTNCSELDEQERDRLKVVRKILVGEVVEERTTYTRRTRKNEEPRSSRLRL